jgi:uncharacterized OB-fold protein
VTDTADELLLPYRSVEAAPFWEGTAKGELRVQRCVDTGRLLFPPSPFSPWGRRRPPEWVVVSGRGRIWSFIVAHGPLMRQFADAAPYVAVTVELDEDPFCRMVGPLVAAPGSALGSVPGDEVKIGQAVVVDLTPWPTADCVVPRWIPG